MRWLIALTKRCTLAFEMRMARALPGVEPFLIQPLYEQELNMSELLSGPSWHGNSNSRVKPQYFSASQALYAIGACAVALSAAANIKHVIDTNPAISDALWQGGMALFALGCFSILPGFALSLYSRREEPIASTEAAVCAAGMILPPPSARANRPGSDAAIDRILSAETPRLTATSRATMLIPISSGVSAPISTPTGVSIRARLSEEKPRSIRSVKT